MNNLFNELNGNNMMAQFQQFRQTFQGDPRKEVQRLLDSGQMSQEMFNRLSQQATQLQRLFGGKR